ncbi:MAG: ATP-binding cassette domain-containing protein [Cyanobacteria bacterium P01_A01_bin.105]
MVRFALSFRFRAFNRAARAAEQPTDVRLKADRVFKGLTRRGDIGVALLEDLTLTLRAGDCVGLTGDSRLAKSVLLQILQGQSAIDAGAIWIVVDGEWVNLTRLSRSQLQTVCHRSIGYLGQVLPISPRSTTFEMVMDPVLERGISKRRARETASRLLTQLNVPQRLWRVSPTQLTQAEQQRTNVARTFAVDYPVYLLNVPMTHLSAPDRQTLLELIEQRKANGSAFVGLFKDEELQLRACTSTLSC